jgi:hypothetical protein
MYIIVAIVIAIVIASLICSSSDITEFMVEISLL